MGYFDIWVLNERMNGKFENSSYVCSVQNWHYNRVGEITEIVKISIYCPFRKIIVNCFSGNRHLLCKNQ